MNARNTDRPQAPPSTEAPQRHDADGAEHDWRARLTALQAALDRIEPGISIFDAQLRLVGWNRSYAKLLGFPPEMAYYGASFESFIRYNAERGDYGPGDPREQVYDRVQLAKVFEPHEFERTRPDGTVLRIRGEPLADGFITVYTDVTRERRAERTILEQNQKLESRVEARTAALVRSERRMRLIMDSIPAMVAYVDAHGRYEYLNQQYETLFGVSLAQASHLSAFDLFDIATIRQLRPQLERALRGETTSFEYELKAKNGLSLYVRTTLVPDFSGSQVQGCFVLTFDLTEQRRSQTLVARAQKLESLGQLTGGLAHDFNNILTVVIGNQEAIAQHAGHDPVVQEYLQPAIRASRRGAELIKGLLSFARRQPLSADHVDMLLSLAQVAQLVRRSLPKRIALSLPGEAHWVQAAEVQAAQTPQDGGIHPESGGAESGQDADAVSPCQSDVDGGEASKLWCWVDPMMLEQALINLLLNARDAIAGDGEIALGAQAVTLDEQQAGALEVKPGAYVCLQVRDNGAGMDAATLAQLFDPFFTTKRPGRGTGLGMAMVYGFVKQSGGAIDVASTLGEGTRVSLWLPASDAPLAPEAEEAPGAPVHTGLALLVDDDTEVRSVVRRQLRELGYAVVDASGADEALKLLAKLSDVRLLLSDVVMPGTLDGRDVAARARASGRVASVVLMSAYAPGAVGMRGVPMLTKPFTRAELLAAIEKGHHEQAEQPGRAG
jgi:PAS domain S-box-containing protein